MRYGYEFPHNSPAQPSPAPPSELLRLIEGERVDYFSASVQTWVPAVITKVDTETGSVCIDCKPNKFLGKQKQRELLRPRTKPSSYQLDRMRQCLRDGGIEKQATALFDRYALQSPPLLRPQSFFALCQEIDRLLGVSGSICGINGEASKKECKALNVDDFTMVFWTLVWGVQKTYGSALDSEQCVNQVYGDPRIAYTFERELGSGTFGSVYLARCRKTRTKRAIKVIHDFSIGNDMSPEIQHLMTLDHPHIVKLYEHFHYEKYIYLVMDFCSEGDLASFIRTNQQPSESFTADVTTQILAAIVHVHARGILHLDLKPQNVMLMPMKTTIAPAQDASGYTLASVHERPHVMVIDLGVAQLSRPGDSSQREPQGTPLYMAPEVWKGLMTSKADVFSIGVILFEMLSLSYPFLVPHETEDALCFWSCKPSAPWERLQKVSDFAIHMCKEMTTFDRLQRPPAAVCLTHPFLQTLAGSHDKPRDKLDKRIASFIERFRAFPERTVLHKSVAVAIARVWPSNQLPSIKQLFQDLDTDKTGLLQKQHVATLLKKHGVDETCAAHIADAMDLDKDGSIDWTEFVAACLHLGSDSLEADLHQVFKNADRDHDGYLNRDDIRSLLVSPNVCGNSVVNDIFPDLCGLDERHFRVDWPTFRRHFSPKYPESANAFTRCEDESISPSQGCLGKLAEMDLTDKKLNLKVLKKHGNVLTDDVIWEISRRGR